MTLGDQKGFSEASPGYTILHKALKAVHTKPFFILATSFLTCQNIAQFFGKLLHVSKQQEH